jgi:hypothetical protein
MAIAFDAVTTATGAGVSSVSTSHATSGSDRIALAVIAWRHNTSTSVSAVTYNSVSFTEVPGSATNNSNFYVRFYYLVAPATGANTFQVTFGGATAFDIGCSILTFTGVDQSVPLGTAANAANFGTTPSVAVSAATDDLVVDAVCREHVGTFTVGAGQTQRVNTICPGGFIKVASSTEPGSTSVTMSWSDTNSGNWAMAAVPLKPKAAAGGSAIPVIAAQYRMRRAA